MKILLDGDSELLINTSFYWSCEFKLEKTGMQGNDRKKSWAVGCDGNIKPLQSQVLNILGSYVEILTILVLH